MGNGSDGGRMTAWLHERRYQIVLWVALIEGVIAAATHGLHIWTIVVLGVLAFASLMLYVYTRDKSNSPFFHDVTWLLAASQLGATIVVAAGAIILGALIRPHRHLRPRRAWPPCTRAPLKW